LLKGRQNGIVEIISTESITSVTSLSVPTDGRPMDFSFGNGPPKSIWSVFRSAFERVAIPGYEDKNGFHYGVVPGGLGLVVQLPDEQPRPDGAELRPSLAAAFKEEAQKRPV
jgi:hypothetical protein